MDHSFAQRVADRAALAHVELTVVLRDGLVSYFDLLSRWNAKINLTSLTDGDEAIDRLLIEPVAAAALLPHGATLMDLGSGGGSPAIPLALALRVSRLVMVESRARKAAFLREAARVTGVSAVVHESRFEELSGRRVHGREMDIVSMRAVRMDEPALASAATFATPAGVLALFVVEGTEITANGVNCRARHRLLGRTDLLLCSPDVPRGTSE